MRCRCIDGSSSRRERMDRYQKKPSKWKKAKRKQKGNWILRKRSRGYASSTKPSTTSCANERPRKPSSSLRILDSRYDSCDGSRLAGQLTPIPSNIEESASTISMPEDFIICSCAAHCLSGVVG